MIIEGQMIILSVSMLCALRDAPVNVSCAHTYAESVTVHIAVLKLLDRRLQHDPCNS